MQLFNAVREHQKTLEKDLADAGPLEHKKDKVIKALDKRAFLDVLMGPAKSQPVSNLVPQEIKEVSTWFNEYRVIIHTFQSRILKLLLSKGLSNQELLLSNCVRKKNTPFYRTENTENFLSLVLFFT